MYGGGLKDKPVPPIPPTAPKSKLSINKEIAICTLLDIINNSGNDLARVEACKIILDQ